MFRKRLERLSLPLKSSLAGRGWKLFAIDVLRTHTCFSLVFFLFCASCLFFLFAFLNASYKAYLAIFRSPDGKKKELKRKGKKNMAFHSDLAADRCTELKPVFDPSRQYEKRKVVWDLFQCNMNSK